jgi:hypothetical protein
MLMLIIEAVLLLVVIEAQFLEIQDLTVVMDW